MVSTAVAKISYLVSFNPVEKVVSQIRSLFPNDDQMQIDDKKHHKTSWRAKFSFAWSFNGISMLFLPTVFWLEHRNLFLFPIESMGLIYLPTWMVQIYGFHVGKYIIHGWYGVWLVPKNLNAQTDEHLRVRRQLLASQNSFDKIVCSHWSGAWLPVLP